MLEYLGFHTPEATSVTSHLTNMLCCAVLCCAVLCCAVLCCAMLCYAIPVSVVCVQDDQGNAQLSILMGGKPSGRSQTLLLASWLRDQIAECSGSVQTNSGQMQSKSRLLGQTAEVATTPPVVNGTQTHVLGGAADAAADRGQMSQGKRPVADMTALPAPATQASLGLSARQVSPKQAALAPNSHLTSAATPRSPALSKPAWASAAGSPRRLGLALQSLGLSPQPAALPDAPSHASIPNWQGLLAEEAGSLGLSFWADEIIRHHPDRARSVLGLLGTAFGVLVHQVSMHCFERGAMMAGVWNLFTALMDAEVQSLEEHVQVGAACMLQWRSACTRSAHQNA